ncbi:hypothetical protein [Lignipirellula cremea]|uniref:Uncharacterized protein n=1 Tax=Lignipirellula cremea TaxID=2528010 RepID=A0A518DSQ6_9BACT|nr:hypothetical protein [Lignipirellula cremea]QDU94872.1 hypothetical protein Pla8534_26800 [Lignipirellula cremea]
MYRELVEIASGLPEIEPFDPTDQDAIGEARALLERIYPVLEATRKIAFPKCAVPVEYRPDFFADHMEDNRRLRNLARALVFAADVAALQGEYSYVAQFGIALLDLANAVRRGGLVVDHLVANAILGCGVGCLRSVRTHFGEPVRRDLLAALGRQEEEREPLAGIAARDAKWEAESGYEEEGRKLSEEDWLDPDSDLPIEDQQALLQLVNDFGKQPESARLALHAEQERHALALPRLLAIDLAIRCWKDRHGQYPGALADLAPDVLPAVPLDPFTSAEFLYRPSDASFALYSPGPDQTDSGGNFGPWPAVSAGGYDLGLDAEDYRSAWRAVP